MNYLSLIFNESGETPKGGAASEKRDWKGGHIGAVLPPLYEQSFLSCLVLLF
jgi:hypothetical protein